MKLAIPKVQMGDDYSHFGRFLLRRLSKLEKLSWKMVARREKERKEKREREK